MNESLLLNLVSDLLIILTAGFLSGVVCRRLGAPMLAGYLLVGVVLGQGGLALVSQQNHEIEYLAEAGVLLLLFSIGIEFSLEELVRLKRFFFVGGAVQMLLVGIPVAGICLIPLDWRAASLIAAATAFSSTVLVFRALAEWGQTESPHGRRAVSILLFQDAALVPLMLLIPIVVGQDHSFSLMTALLLVGKTALFVAVVVGARKVFARWGVALLSELRSRELVVLFTLTVLGATGLAAAYAGLPVALGAFAAGLMLSGNRMSRQFDTLVLPYRECFAAVFFVSLGMLLRPGVFAAEPLLLAAGVLLVLVLKAAAAALALRCVGLPWPIASAMGLGLSQMGEFSFVLLSVGLREELIDTATYNRLLFIALATLILTPILLRLGLTRISDEALIGGTDDRPLQFPSAAKLAIVVGAGPVGRHAASQLETLGADVCLIDQSPVNLHEFAAQGFRTVNGDARDQSVLQRANAANCRLALISVPDDRAAYQITQAVREVNRSCMVLVRCRYQNHAAQLEAVGADVVISEEREVSMSLARLIDDVQQRLQLGEDG